MATRDFDEEFDYEHAAGHSFTLGGQEFRTLPVAPPGAYLAAGKGLVAAVKFLRRLVVPEDRPGLERVLEMPDTTGRILDMAPEVLHAAARLLDAEDTKDAAEKKTARKEALVDLRTVVEQSLAPEVSQGVTISAYQVDTVAQWLMEVAVGRPTNSPSPSGNGDGRISATSKATSRAPVKAGKA